MLNLVQFYIIEHTEPSKQRALAQSLTGPLLTDEKRLQQIAAQAPDEPPMPDWWVDDEDASQSSIAAARQIGA